VELSFFSEKIVSSVLAGRDLVPSLPGLFCSLMNPFNGFALATKKEKWVILWCYILYLSASPTLLALILLSVNRVQPPTSRVYLSNSSHPHDGVFLGSVLSCTFVS
jgi:hypothetical protein